LNLLILDLGHDLKECRAFEWMRQCTGKFMHVHINASCPQLFYALIGHEDSLTPRLHHISTHDDLSFACRNVEPARRKWQADKKADRELAAREKVAAAERKANQWELWIKYDHTRPKALTMREARDAVLVHFSAVDHMELAPLQLGGGEHSSDLPSCTIKVVAWGLKSARMPWYLLDPASPNLPIRYDHNWKQYRHACRICHNVCTRCSEFVQEPSIPPGKWKDQKYWECPFWKQLNPVQVADAPKSKDISISDMMKVCKRYRKK
jgi:hypothetical protein